MSKKGALLYESRGRGPQNATCGWCYYRQGKDGKTCTLEQRTSRMVTSNDPACIAFTPWEGWQDGRTRMGRDKTAAA